MKKIARDYVSASEFLKAVRDEQVQDIYRYCYDPNDYDAMEHEQRYEWSESLNVSRDRFGEEATRSAQFEIER